MQCAAPGAQRSLRRPVDRRQVLGLLATGAAPLAAAAQDLTPARALPFRLRSRFWMNLHHTLAEAFQPRSQRGDWRQPQGWSAQETRDWLDALQAYRRAFAEQDLLNDDRFQALRLALLGLGDSQPLPAMEAALQPLAQALSQAAAPYRRQLWPAHDAANQAWMQEARTRLSRWGSALRERLEAVLQPALPELILVDLVPLSGDRRGAYTDGQPPHTVMPSLSEDYQGDAALEMLFHESSHTGMDDRLREDIEALLAPRGLQDRKQLWHAVQFYTVGHVTQRLLSVSGRDYLPYAQRRGVFGRGWAFAVEPLNAHWRPFLEGRRPRAQALAGLVAACYPA